MNALTAAIALQRRNRLIHEAAEYRRASVGRTEPVTARRAHRRVFRRRPI